MYIFYSTVTFRIVRVTVNTLNTERIKYRQLFVFELCSIVLQDKLGMRF